MLYMMYMSDDNWLAERRGERKNSGHWKWSNGKGMQQRGKGCRCDTIRNWVWPTANSREMKENWFSRIKKTYTRRRRGQEGEGAEWRGESYKIFESIDKKLERCSVLCLLNTARGTRHHHHRRQQQHHHQHHHHHHNHNHSHHRHQHCCHFPTIRNGRRRKEGFGFVVKA